MINTHSFQPPYLLQPSTQTHGGMEIPWPSIRGSQDLHVWVSEGLKAQHSGIPVVPTVLSRSFMNLDMKDLDISGTGSSNKIVLCFK